MKHPNKKIETINNSFAKRRMNSCFNYWLSQSRNKKITLTEQSLTQAITSIMMKTL